MRHLRLIALVVGAAALTALCVPVAATAIALGPSVSLTSPTDNELFTTGQPTFTGSASTGPEFKNAVTVDVYRGSSATGTPVEALNATPDPGGAWTVVPTSALADGQYTARAEQDAILGIRGLSDPVTFRIKVHPPALTLSHPGAGASVPRFDVFFSGQAGSELGDSPYITVDLYRGAQPTGSTHWERQVQSVSSSWFVDWGRKLQAGTYTVQAVQTDDAGHTARVTQTFRVVPGPRKTIGLFVLLSRSRVASVSISCLAPSKFTCAGSVLVVTKQSFRTTRGGPKGPLRVLFVYVSIPGGGTQNVQGTVSGPVAHALRRAKGDKVEVTAMLSKSGGAAGHVSAERTLFLK